MGAAYLFTLGETPWQYIASGVFVLSLLLDRVDGTLARLTGKASRFGHNYDLIADSLSNALVFVGIGIGLRQSSLGDWAIPLGLIAGVAVIAVLLSVVRIENRKGERAAEIGNSMGFDPDDAMLAVPLAIIFGWGVQLILAASIGASIFAVIFIIYHRRSLSSEASDI